MRRSPLKRGAPLARKTRLKPRREAPRRGRVVDESYRRAVADLPCYVAESGIDAECLGAVEPNHMDPRGDRAFGMKVSDHLCAPFCHGHHRHWHDCSGPFAGWSKERRREYAALAVESTMVAVARGALAAQKEAVPW